MEVRTVKSKIGLGALLALLVSCTGCEFTPDGFGGMWNIMVTVLAVAMGAVLLFFIVLGFVSVFYKGKNVMVKVLKKKESKVLQGGMMGKTAAGYKQAGGMSRKQRREKGRIRFSKVIVELDGKTKTLKCSDIVILDKLSVGKISKVRVRFGEIIKIMK
jgi:hypothetical protein